MKKRATRKKSTPVAAPPPVEPTPRAAYAEKIADALKAQGFTHVSVKDDFTWHTVHAGSHDKKTGFTAVKVFVYAPGKYSVDASSNAKVETTWDPKPKAAEEPMTIHNRPAPRRISEPKDDFSIDYSPHHRSTSRGRSFENAFLGMFRNWVAYAQAHEREFGSPIGDDGYIGPEWEQIGKSLLDMLNGEIGGLDGGTMDSLIRQNLRRGGFSGE